MTECSGYERLADKVRAESNSPMNVIQPCQSLVYDEQFLLRDKHTGKPLVGVHYRIEGVQILQEGRTDKHGCTIRVYTGDHPEPLNVYLIEESAELYVGSDDGSGCF